MAGRIEVLQELAVVLLTSGITASLGYVDTGHNPADPPSRAGGGCVLPGDCGAVREARARARSCEVWPASIFGGRTRVQ
jgi:hypothetical protein